jgi:hypothetical protein
VATTEELPERNRESERSERERKEEREGRGIHPKYKAWSGISLGLI